MNLLRKLGIIATEQKRDWTEKPKTIAVNLNRLWINDPRQFRGIMKDRRRARLIKRQGMKWWTIEGTNIFALNKKNALRKYKNQLK